MEAMKAWQHGYDLSYLLDLEKRYSEYNQFSVSPFSKMKKNTIAEALHEGTLKLFDDACFDLKLSKTKTPISMYGDTVFAEKYKGDVVISRLAGNCNTLKRELSKYNKSNNWLYIWTENSSHVNLAETLGYTKVGTKISTFGELISVYYRGAPREFPKIDPAELLSIHFVEPVDTSVIQSIASKLNNLPEFTNHYSKYNKGHSWSALSLRGFSPDPTFITKAEVMNDKWRKQHEGQDFKLQDTSLYDQFPEVKELIAPYGSDVQRVRFMKLSPNGGELERHTDQVDCEQGGTIGKQARLHFPIKTNPDVIFTVWNVDGSKSVVNMKCGECWFLDTRKPHTAINGGTEDRIHLVVDITVEDCLYKKLVGVNNG